ncbi:MAG: metal-dependent hydrolase [Acidimicrobiia bacterium]|nr:metal-dependent hydrolase [Acidimicrobiia bacterium]
MILWHLGGTIALVRYAFRDPNMDLRLLMVGAILPDLIDKPLGRVFHVAGHESGKLWGHTLLFSAVLMILILVITKRGTSHRRTWFPLAVGSLFHLVLDAMWTLSETFLWPFLGTDFTPADPGNLGDSLIDGLTSPWVVAGEVVGLIYLIWLWRAAGLSDRVRRRAFQKTGSVGVPIGG